MSAKHRRGIGGALKWWRYLPVLVVVLAMIIGLSYLFLGNDAAPDGKSETLTPGASALSTYGPTASVSSTAPAPSQPTVKSKRSKPFLPHAVVIDGIGTNQVERLPRIWVNDNLIEFPSPTGYNPSTYAWDTSSAMPGSKQGTVILVAHTYSTNDQALGNRLIRSVGVGEAIVLEGSHRSVRYIVTERQNLHGPDEYYQVARKWLDEASAPLLALTVCSDYNQATGDWDSKMVWLARPMK